MAPASRSSTTLFDVCAPEFCGSLRTRGATSAAATLWCAGRSVATASAVAGLAGCTKGVATGAPTGLMLKSELMAASGPSSSQTPSSPVGNPSVAAVTAALENALNFPLTPTGYFYEKCRYGADRVVKQWFGNGQGRAA